MAQAVVAMGTSRAPGKKKERRPVGEAKATGRKTRAALICSDASVDLLVFHPESRGAASESLSPDGGASGDDGVDILRTDGGGSGGSGAAALSGVPSVDHSRPLRLVSRVRGRGLSLRETVGIPAIQRGRTNHEIQTTVWASDALVFGFMSLIYYIFIFTLTLKSLGSLRKKKKSTVFSNENDIKLT
ncbi:hypothetical protein EYF80_067936 [Liparis tanakae]|uniref:Uncharacterized protein n=1 Tax=Liparis tanakae TaxID=230148 RepID=A0A4Z2E0N2_9TELE|nr:hypothetical protein EYF80_067936 [Liparis tanakae]